MQMTFTQYDEFVNQIQLLKHVTYWPSIADLDYMQKDPERWILFACYLQERNETPHTNEDKYAKKNLLAFINSHLDLVDEEDEDAD